MSSLLFAAQYVIIGFFILIHLVIGIKRSLFASLYYLFVFAFTISILFVGLHYFNITDFIASDKIIELIKSSGLVPGEYDAIYSEPEVINLMVAAVTSLVKVVLWILGYFILKPIITWIFSLVFNIFKKIKKSKVYILIYLTSFLGAAATWFLFSTIVTDDLLYGALLGFNVDLTFGGSIEFDMVFALLVGILKVLSVIVMFYVLRIVTYIFFFAARRMFVSKEKRAAKKQKIKAAKAKKKTFFRIPVSIVRGTLSGLFVLYPILLIISIVSSVIPAYHTAMSLENRSEEQINSDYNQFGKYLDEIEKFNRESIFSQLNSIKINNVGLADFSINYFTETKIAGSEQSISLVAELREIGEILSIIEEITGSSFDINNLTSENISLLAPLFDYIKESEFIGTTADSGLRIFLRLMIEKSDLTVERKEMLLETVAELKISADFGSLYSLAETLLRLGNVEQLMEYILDPSQILNLETNQEAVIDLVLWVAQLNIIDYSVPVLKVLLYSKSFTDMITWYDDIDDKINYIDNVFSFIEAEDYLLKQISNFAVLLDVMYQVHPTSMTRADFYANFSPLFLLTEADAQWVTLFAETLIQNVDFIFDAAPFLIDLIKDSEDPYIVELGYLLSEQSNLGEYMKAELLNLVPIYEALIDLGIAEDLLADQLNVLSLLDTMGKNGLLVPFLEDNIYTSTFIEAYINRVAENLILTLVGEDETFKRAIMNANDIIRNDSENSIFSELKIFIELLDLLYADPNFSLENFEPLMLQSVLINIEASDLTNLITRSTYIYVLLEDSIRQIDQVVIPDSVLNTEGMYAGLIDRAEIVLLVEAIKVLNITDFTGLNPEDLVVANILESIKKDSVILNSIIWAQLSIALEDQLEFTVLESEKTTDELVYILETLQDIGLADSLANFDESALMNIDVPNLIDVRNNRIYEQERYSRLFERIMATFIVDLANEEYFLMLDYSDVDSDEITRMLGGLIALGITSIDSMVVNADVLTLTQIENLMANNSLVVDRIISQQIYLTLNRINEIEISELAYTTIYKDQVLVYPEITKNELNALLAAVAVFDKEKETGIGLIDFRVDQFSLDDLKDVINTNSIIIYQSASKAIKTTFAEIIVLPERAFVNNDPENDVKKEEIYNLIDSLKAGGFNQLDAINGFDYKQMRLQDLKMIVSSDYRSDDSNESAILTATISYQINQLSAENQIIINSDVLNEYGEVSTQEIANMFNSLQAARILTLDDTTNLVDNATLTNLQLMLFNEGRASEYVGESKILKATISYQILQLGDQLVINDDVLVNGQISDTELKNLTNSLLAAEIDNLDDIANLVDTATLSNLQLMLFDENREEEHLGESKILKATISHQIMQLEDQLVINDDVLVNGQISDTELKNLTNSLLAAEIDNLDDIANLVDNASLSGLQAMLFDEYREAHLGESKILKATISHQIMQLEDQLVINDDVLVNGQISDTELKNLTNSLLAADIDNLDDIANLVDNASLSDLQVMLFDEYREGIQHLGESKILKATISHQILQLGDQLVINENALTAGQISDIELKNMTNSLLAGEIDKLTDIADQIKKASLKTLDLMLFDQNRTSHIGESLILKATISDRIYSLKDDGQLIINESVLENGQIKDSELSNLIKSLQAGGVDELENVLNVISGASLDQLKSMLYNDDREAALIGESAIVIDTIQTQIQKANGKGLTIPDFVIVDNRITKDETIKLIDALKILGVNDVNSLNATDSFATMTYGKLKQLMGDDSSAILVMTITQYIEDAYETNNSVIPTDAYQPTRQVLLQKTEILSLIEAIFVVSGEPLNDESELTLSNAHISTQTTKEVEVAIIDDLLALNSIMIHYLLSDTIINLGLVSAELEVEFDGLVPREEIAHISKSVAILGLVSLADLRVIGKETIIAINENEFKTIIDYGNPLHQENEGMRVVYHLIRNTLNYPDATRVQLVAAFNFLKPRP